MKGGKVMEEEKRRMEEEMIAELPSALINHCLWNDQREDGGGEQGGRMEKERCLLQREINDNGTERDGCWNQILISFHTFFSHNFCLSVCIFFLSSSPFIQCLSSFSQVSVDQRPVLQFLDRPLELSLIDSHVKKFDLFDLNFRFSNLLV